MGTAPKASAKRTSAPAVLHVGQTVTFRIGGQTWHGRVVGTLGGRGSKRKQLVRIETKPKRREEEPVQFSVPADLVHAQ